MLLGFIPQPNLANLMAETLWAISAAEMASEYGQVGAVYVIVIIKVTFTIATTIGSPEVCREHR